MGDTSKHQVPVVSRTAPRLHLTLKDPSGKAKRIRCRRVVTLFGSRDGCKIQLKHAEIDGVHLALINTGHRVFGVDLVTTHGTLLNGLKMEQERLGDGDVIKIGAWEFGVELKQSPEVARNGTQEPSLDPTPESIALKHEASGRILKPTREACTIGRRSGCDIAVSDQCVSRIHALLFFLEGHPFIVDLLSDNGLLINGFPSRFAPLSQGDALVIGETEFGVHLLGMPTGAGAAPGNGRTAKSPVPPSPPPHAPDLIDIHKTESSQRWRIADHTEKKQPKS